MIEQRRAASRAAAVLCIALAAACARTPEAAVPSARTSVLDTRHGRTTLVLDIDTTSGDQGELDQLLAKQDADVTVIAAPTGYVWRRIRELKARNLRLTLVDACSEGRTAACTREVAPFIAAMRNASVWLPTGSVIEDSIAASQPAPPAVVIPTGQFMTGVTGGTETWVARFAGRLVRLKRPIAVARTETTVAQFRRFVEASGYHADSGCQHHTRDQIWEQHPEASWSQPVFAQTDAHPVTCVTFEDASAYAVWVTKQTGHTWRLPTEAEAEFFVRSGETGRFGVDVHAVTDLCALANGADRASALAYANDCDDHFERTAPVGSFPPNAFGLSDATGNLWEMTSGCVGREFMRVLRDRLHLAPSDASALDGGSCPGRHAVRGGAFLSSPGNLEASHREIEGYRSNRIGFRLVRELP